MIKLDLSKTGATTILSCGTTNAGHYAFCQQGIGSWAPDDYAKSIYNELAKHAPAPPGDKWVLCGIELQDYKTGGKFYRIYAQYEFRKEKAKYWEEVDLSPEDVKEIYIKFSEAVHKYK